MNNQRWTKRKTNQEIQKGSEEQTSLIAVIEVCKNKLFGHIIQQNNFITYILEEKMFYKK